jgi:hypothetical protein
MGIKFGLVGVTETRVLKGMFRPVRDGTAERRGKLHNEDFQNVYSSPNIIRVIKSRRMRWTSYVARIG